jgi:hypothetical protein
MQHPSTTRLDTSHTWEEMAAFIQACPEPLCVLLEFRDSGRMRIHYVTRQGGVVGQAVCTLSRGWMYGLPHGIPSGPVAAAAAGKDFCEKARS